MEKSSKLSLVPITDSIQKLNLSSTSNSARICNPNSKEFFSGTQSSVAGVRRLHRVKPPSLVSLCLGVVGKHLEDIIADLEEIAVSFPSDIKAAIAAIARRRKLLDDNVILSLADSSWEILDLSGSDVTDSGLTNLAGVCKSLRAVDISRCEKVTAAGVSELVRQCQLLETLRCGGCPSSEYTARSCLGIFKPHLNDVGGDSWEELDATDIAHGAESFRWLIWPRIDKGSMENLSSECPRIVVNPRPSLFGYRGIEVPREALPDIILDDPFVKDVDPKTWAVCGLRPRTAASLTSMTLSSAPSESAELSIAEKFRLAFVERDARMAPKRAKNARQRQRRAERDWVSTDSSAKAVALASRLSKSLHTKN